MQIPEENKSWANAGGGFIPEGRSLRRGKKGREGRWVCVCSFLQKKTKGTHFQLVKISAALTENAYRSTAGIYWNCMEYLWLAGWGDPCPCWFTHREGEESLQGPSPTFLNFPQGMFSQEPAFGRGTWADICVKLQ